MHISRILNLVILFFTTCSLFAQKDPVLFSVNGNPVNVSEFKYIYEKSNTSKADYSEKSLKESLDLYVNFKMKVAKARELRMDTIPSLVAELDGYKKMLADSYLIDKEITEKLAKQYFNRSQWDVRVSHIFIAAGPDDLPTDTLKAYQKVLEIEQKLKAGAKFEDLEPIYNEDTYSKPAHGDLGWMTSMLPNGFYQLENLIYSLDKGEVGSMPARSKLGWHFVKVTDKRPARGEMEIAQILIKIPKGQAPDKYLKKADSIYTELKKGVDFGQMARTFSDDKNTQLRNGYLGFITINQYSQKFEDEAFSLKNDGDITKPFQTEMGFHILRRISKKDNDNFEKDKKIYMTKIMQNERFSVSRQELIDKIKRQNNYTVSTKAYREYYNSIDNKFFEPTWTPPSIANEPLFNIGDVTYTTDELNQYLVKNTRQRVRLNKSMSPGFGFEQMFQDFVSEKALEYEQGKLEEKYPEYKALTREYEEGFLFFEVTNREVWSKASQDSVGITEYYNKNKDKYMWGERATLSTFTIHADSPEQFLKDCEYVKALDTKDLLRKLNTKDKEVVSYTTEIIEKPKEGVMKDDMSWKVGSTSYPERNTDQKSGTIKKIISITPPAPKELKDARGFVIADYQDYLDKQWIEKLKKEYKVVINEDVFNSLIKK